MDTAKTVSVCNLLWCEGNNAWGHSRGCGQGSCVSWPPTEKTSKWPVAFFSLPQPCWVDLWWHCLWVISAGFDNSGSQHQWETHTIRKASVSMATWRSKGLALIRLTLGQSLLLAQHIGDEGGWGAILPDLSLFVAVKIPLAASPRDWLSPPHPSLTRRPLSLMPALGSRRGCVGGLGPAALYWFVSSAPWCRRNNGDLNVRWWSHFELK